MDRGGGDVNDGSVEHSHELTNKDDGQDKTGTHRAFAAAKLAGACITGQDVGHVTKPAVILIQVPGHWLSWY